MEKVLLAIDGIYPNRKILEYAVDLCKRIKAELNILQVIDRRVYKAYLKKMQKGFSATSKYLSDSMIAITFAEAGEHDTALALMPEAFSTIKSMLPEDQNEDIGYDLRMTRGDSGKEIIDYVEKNRDVVMAIYDPAESVEDTKPAGNKDLKKRKTEVSTAIRQKLSIPIVVIGTSK